MTQLNVELLPHLKTSVHHALLAVSNLSLLLTMLLHLERKLRNSTDNSVYDRRACMGFTAGQFRTHLAVGMGEMAYETLRMVVEKQRDAVFRHWLLGFGSGDITVQREERVRSNL